MFIAFYIFGKTPGKNPRGSKKGKFGNLQFLSILKYAYFQDYIISKIRSVTATVTLADARIIFADAKIISADEKFIPADARIILAEAKIHPASTLIRNVVAGLKTARAGVASALAEH
jgi:hypothetical protein